MKRERTLTLVFAEGELSTLRFCSASEIAAIYEIKKSTYLERIQKTTGRVREAYEDCLSTLEKMKSESENR